MENFNHQMLNGLYQLLASSPIKMLFKYSLPIGVLTGVVSLLPFAIKRIPHAVVAIIALLASIFIAESFGLTKEQMLYSEKAYFIAKFIGDYVVGCVFGLIFANLIQRIRGDHDHATNN